MDIYIYNSPKLLLKIGIEDGRVIWVKFDENRYFQKLKENDLRADVLAQLDEYFKGHREKFDLKVKFTTGTSWQKQVWREIQKIPYGETITYKELVKNLGDGRKTRAVASACGANPIPIIVPCHRVVGTNNIGGYGGGVNLKKWLLEIEGIYN